MSEHTTITKAPELWPTSVDGNEILNELRNAYNKYVVLPAQADIALSLWTLYTYGFENFEFSPRLAITSPEKRCGKSTLLILLQMLTRKPLVVSNISTASMFRIIESEKPTLLVDEADTFLREHNDMIGVLNAGHRRNGCVVRTEYKGKTAIPTVFNCFSPCAIAAIRQQAIAETILDRSIIIQMRRKLPTETVCRLRTREAETEFADLVLKCARFMADHGEELGRARPILPDYLSSRAADNWEALFAIADFVGNDWPQMARNACSSLYTTSDIDEENTSIQLLSDIHNILSHHKSDYIPTQILCEMLLKIPDSPWQEFGYRHEPITPRHIAKLLRGYNIRPMTIRHNYSTAKGYKKDDFSDAFNRYLGQNIGNTDTKPENESSDVSDTYIQSVTI